jgi:hypothetical protein
MGVNKIKWGNGFALEKDFISFCPMMHLHAPSKNSNTTIMLMQNPMAHSFSLLLGYSLQNEVESHTMFGSPSWNVQAQGKFMNVCKVTCKNPT